MSEAASPRRAAPVRRGRLSAPIALSIVAVALLGAILLIFRTIETEREERAQVARTSEVLGELRNIGRAALNAETGQRGYLITLDPRYLRPYQLGREQYRPAIRRLRALLGEDTSPRQRELVAEIATLADTKFTELARAVELIEAGDRTGAQRLILTDEGQKAMERLRLAIREMEDLEQRDLDRASSDSAHAESRVLPLLSALLGLVIITIALGFRLTRRAARAETEAAQAAAVAEARDRADLLARELNHRVKNLFAVILAIVRMTGKDAPEAKPAVDKIAERINALLIAHQVTQGTPENPVASLRTLLETTVRPYLSADRTADLAGPPVELSARQVTPLGLVLHELTTNAVKYGCWKAGGPLRVGWTVDAGVLAIDWKEVCENLGTESERQGFGSLLMTSAARQLGGSIDRSISASGVHVRIEIPVGG